MGPTDGSVAGHGVNKLYTQSVDLLWPANRGVPRQHAAEQLPKLVGGQPHRLGAVPYRVMGSLGLARLSVEKPERDRVPRPDFLRQVFLYALHIGAKQPGAGRVQGVGVTSGDLDFTQLPPG
jgi:hypothetical protein